MISDALRESVYGELEREYPMRGAVGGSGPAVSSAGAASPAVASRIPVDPATLWKQELFALSEAVEDQLLFQFHALFDMPAASSTVQQAVHHALEQLYNLERACSKGGAYDAVGYALFLLRQHWHAAGGSTAVSPLGPVSLLTGLYHIEQGSFFHKVSVEIADWTRRFLLVERYHRLDAVEHENRLDRYRALRTGLFPDRIQHLDDVLIWLEFRLLGDQATSGVDIGALSHRITEELQGKLASELFPGMPLQAVLYLLLRCHQFCLAEIIEPAEQQRFEQILATRQLDSLLDLMRVVLHSIMHEQRLPEVGALLDRLQAEGFNIDHQRFRDPYEAALVPVADTERFDNVRLPLFLPLERLSGKFAEDLGSNQQQLLTWQGRVLREALSEAEAYRLAQSEALPRAHLIHQLVRFAVTWFLAQYPWPLTGLPEELEEPVRKMLPERVVRHLIKPRKGYELKSKQDLTRLIEAESQRQREALQRIARSHRIQGLHDYSHFTRYLIFQRLQEKAGVDPSLALLEEEAPAFLLDEFAEPVSVAEYARKWSINARQAYPHSLETLSEYFLQVSPAEHILPELGSDFVASENERKRIYHDLLDQLVPVFHLLLVARGRNQAQLPRLALAPRWIEDVTGMVKLLAPPLEMLERVAQRRVKDYLDRMGGALYRQPLAPCLLSAGEWRAYLAWETHRRIGKDLERFLEEGDLDLLLKDLEQAAQRVELPPRELFVETVQSALLSLLTPAESGATLTDAVIRELTLLLPQLDCGACGQSSCRDFARTLLLGRAQPQGCVQLPAHGLAPLTAKVLRLKDSGNEQGSVSNLLETLSNRRVWQRSAERHTLQGVLSASGQKARRLFFERVRQVWERLTPKPQIFKCPDLEVFYRELCRFIGYSATERLREEEKRLLVDHGELRQQAEWQAFKERQNWLLLARRQRQSRPLLRGQDPAWSGAESYRNVFFLHQLRARDRQLVLRSRLERHQDGFSYWWNEDLLAMNLADFSIRDWEDFSKIIKNAYWHQESSPGGGSVLTLLEDAKAEGHSPLAAVDPERILQIHLGQLLDEEHFRSAQRQEHLQRVRRGEPIHDLAGLRTALQGMADELGRDVQQAGSRPGETGAGERRAGSDTGSGGHYAAEDRQALDLDQLWERFQQSGLNFSPSFRCLWVEMLPLEQEAWQVEDLAGGPAGNGDHRGARSTVIISAWDETLAKRSAFIRSLLMACIKELLQEQAECAWLEAKLTESSPGRPPLDSLRLFVRERFRQGVERGSLEAELEHLLRAHPAYHQGFCEDALQFLVCRRQYEILLQADHPGMGLKAVVEAAPGPLDLFLELKSSLDRLLERRQTMDRERLLHYLFLLAKMEGNLDALTGLLREIRETSDIIEAAWLRFTEERILEGPAPKPLPGTTLGIPLLVSHLKDKQAINRGLREGIGRREKRQVSAAFNELVNFIRYHVLLQREAPTQDGVQLVLTDMQNAGYDLTGIEAEALHTAIQKEWKRREQLEDQKIGVYTTVTARRLAAQHAELQEAERVFYKVRLDLLKDADGGEKQPGEGLAAAASSRPRAVDVHHDIASRRGVALGQIKEEMYRQLSDLLESERITTFHKRIRQIVQQLDQKRQEIHAAWVQGEINRRTLFYLLRQYQKTDGDPSWEDFQRFLTDHWFRPLAELRGSQRPDRAERIGELDEKFQALLGVSLIQLEQETAVRAEQEYTDWVQAQLAEVKMAGMGP